MKATFLRIAIALVLAYSITMTSKSSTVAHALNNAVSLSSSKTMKTIVQVHWFRNADLRLHDNPALSCAIQESSKRTNPERGASILPIYCFDPRFVGGSNSDASKSEFGSLKCGPRRAEFLVQTVANLRQNLEEKGSGLVVARGRPEEVFSSILRYARGDHEAIVLKSADYKDSEEKKEDVPRPIFLDVFCQEEIASEELSVDEKVRSVLDRENDGTKSSHLKSIWGSTLYHPTDLPYDGGVSGMPDVFTPFRNAVEKHCEIGKPLLEPKREDLKLPFHDNDTESLRRLHEAVTGSMDKQCSLTYMPTLEELGYTPEEIDVAKNEHDPRGVMVFEGGETAALARVQDYIWDKDRLKVYFDTRNGMIGESYSTKFAPWLALGCLSPRYVAQQCLQYEKERIANKSTYWAVFELLWRDFFRFFAKKHGNSIFFLDGTLGRAAHGTHPNSRRWNFDKRRFQAWKDGRTGFPFVDANMRELAATGFMSNRGRQNVCSFLSIDMSMDWRYGADYFEEQLLDYDVCSNWGNWCAGAGMTGGRLNRFNVVKQAKDYDCEGDYVRLWLPELKDVPTCLLFEPWKMTSEEQGKFGVRLGVDYPNPIVPPPVPYTHNRSNGSSKQGKQSEKRRNDRGNANPNRGKGQKQDMKSLKQGSSRIGG